MVVWLEQITVITIILHWVSFVCVTDVLHLLPVVPVSLHIHYSFEVVSGVVFEKILDIFPSSLTRICCDSWLSLNVV